MCLRALSVLPGTLFSTFLVLECVYCTFVLKIQINRLNGALSRGGGRNSSQGHARGRRRRAETPGGPGVSRMREWGGREEPGGPQGAGAGTLSCGRRAGPGLGGPPDALGGDAEPVSPAPLRRAGRGARRPTPGPARRAAPPGGRLPLGLAPMAPARRGSADPSAGPAPPFGGNERKGPRTTVRCASGSSWEMVG